MRPHHSRYRRRSISCSTVLATVSLLANFFLAAALLLLYLGNTEIQTSNCDAQQYQFEIDGMREEFMNVSASLDSALVALHDKDAEVLAAKQSLRQHAKAEEERSNSLAKDADSFRHALGPGKLWLTIGIPTIPRRAETDYLTRTLSSLFEELPLDPTDLLFGRVKVLVMNNRPGEHPVWLRIRSRIFDERGRDSDDFAKKGRLYTEFVDNPGDVQDPTPDAEDPDDSNNPKNRPGREVRRQTCDLISLLEMAQPLSSYYVFMEDDFRAAKFEVVPVTGHQRVSAGLAPTSLIYSKDSYATWPTPMVCPNMLRILSYAVRKLNTVPGYHRWLGLRFSYGMNGILLRNDDLELLTAYLRKHTARLPPDLLWAEWILGRRLELRQAVRGRRLAVFRHNLLDHIGARSSFTVRANRPEWPRCYHPMSRMWSLGKSEKFNEIMCGHSDISPCPAGDSGEVWTKYPLQWPNITDGADEDHLRPPLEEWPPPQPIATAAAQAAGLRTKTFRQLTSL